MFNPTATNETTVSQLEFLKKVWTDEAFGARLDSDPRAALAEIGGSYPDDVEIRVLRDTETVKHLRIPTAVREAELSDEELVGTFSSHFAEDVEIKVVRDTDTVKYLHVPAAPCEGEISDEELVTAQGGTWTFPFQSSVYYGPRFFFDPAGNDDPLA